MWYKASYTRRIANEARTQQEGADNKATRFTKPTRRYSYYISCVIYRLCYNSSRDHAKLDIPLITAVLQCLSYPVTPVSCGLLVSGPVGCERGGECQVIVGFGKKLLLVYVIMVILQSWYFSTHCGLLTVCFECRCLQQQATNSPGTTSLIS